MAVKYGYPMHPYYERMPEIGAALKRELKPNTEQIKEEEAKIAQEVARVKAAGKAVDKMNEKGEWDVWQRIDYLVDEGTWCPLHTIYDPMFNEEGQTNVIDGLGR
ncbi:MAG: glutaconyl-CoA decarboxylase subunit alpha, partial [Clostridiales Family XIII bacterium]|nr:glutaconyl-CoA decarboxylase subunit alpha [Clostridiales Family XIII bacterium]